MATRSFAPVGLIKSLAGPGATAGPGSRLFTPRVPSVAARLAAPTSFQTCSAPSRNLGAHPESPAKPTGLQFPDCSESLSSQNPVLRVLFSEASRNKPLDAPRLFPTTIPIMLHAAQDAASARGPLPVGVVIPPCWARGGWSET